MVPRDIIPVQKGTLECIRANRNMLWAVKALDYCSVGEGEGGQAGFTPEKQPGW